MLGVSEYVCGVDKMKTVKYKDNSNYLMVLGDTHINNPNTDMKLLQKHIDMIRKTRAPWVHLGDWVDAIASDDRRFSVEDQRTSVVESYLDMEELFNPIIPSCLAVLRGNHGTKWARQEGDMIKVIARRWGVPYLGYCGFVVFNGTKIFLHHGAGGGRKRGAKTIRLNEWSQFIEADVYIQGHTHTYVSFDDELITPYRVKKRYYVNVPGYIRSYRGHDGYIEELGLPPQGAGCVRLELSPIKASVVLE